jgi:hypothetical protein
LLHSWVKTPVVLLLPDKEWLTPASARLESLKWL